MTSVVDCHVHVFPDNFESLMKKVAFSPLSSPLTVEKALNRLQNLRRQARAWMKPVMSSLHGLQTHVRYLPEFVRNNLDELGGLMPLPGLLIESTLVDLTEAMQSAGVHQVLAIAHPPFISNEFILEISAQYPHKIVPAVNIPKGTNHPGQVLKRYVAQGAKALKIHAAADGEGPDSPRYRALVRTASDLGLPVIIHTGCVHIHLFYRDPFQGSAEQFTKWYETYPNTQFILAHMNFHEPPLAFDLCEEFGNVHVDTSWQPTEVIGEAVRRIGAERVLFGSDWPLIGNNMGIGRQRIQECIEIGLLNLHQSKLILGDNATKLLGLTVNAN